MAGTREKCTWKVVPQEGFEPPATRLRSGCSTAELLRPDQACLRYRLRPALARKPLTVVDALAARSVRSLSPLAGKGLG